VDIGEPSGDDHGHGSSTLLAGAVGGDPPFAEHGVRRAPERNGHLLPRARDLHHVRRTLDFGHFHDARELAADGRGAGAICSTLDDDRRSPEGEREEKKKGEHVAYVSARTARHGTFSGDLKAGGGPG
jgi:hypothetical protein